MILPLLVVLVVGIVDFARAVYSYSVVASAAREGARYGIMHPTNPTGISTEAKRNMTGLDLSPGNVAITSICSPDCSKGSSLTVTVSYVFNPVTGFFPPAFSMSSKSTMTIE